MLREITMKLSLYLAASLGIAPQRRPAPSSSSPRPALRRLPSLRRPRAWRASPSRHDLARQACRRPRDMARPCQVHVAARQIVPEGTPVVFGDGVDRELPVDWQGGRPWNLVWPTPSAARSQARPRPARSPSPVDLSGHSRRSPPRWWDHGGANARLVPQCGCRLATGA